MKNVLIVILAVLTAACNSAGSTENGWLLPTDPETLAQIGKGKLLVEQNCYTCHSPTAPLEGRLAPPMAAVKSHYINESTTLPDFATELVRFVGDPSPVYSKMPGAVRRFGLMPALQYPEEDLKAIAAFVYYADLEQPDWFEAHQLEEKAGNMKEFSLQREYPDLGRQYAMKAKSILGKNLLQAIAKSGPEGAVAFCNVRAESLTDSAGIMQNAHIRRVSDRPRNPANAADSLELVQVEALRQDLAVGITLPYRVHEGDDFVTGFYPIVTNEMCLKCHGDKTTDISSATLSALESLYPDDMATGYLANQLRGIWVVKMPRD